jgi:hypothetical protein
MYVYLSFISSFLVNNHLAMPNDMEALLSPILLGSAVNSPPPLSGNYVPSVTDLSLDILLHVANTSHSDLQKIQEGVIKLCDSIGLQAGNFIA